MTGWLVQMMTLSLCTCTGQTFQIYITSTFFFHKLLKISTFIQLLKCAFLNHAFLQVIFQD